jgi:phospholipase/carboxylesterase
MRMATLIDGPRIEPASGGPARSLVILLHGYGSNGDDLITLGLDWRTALPDTAFVAPDAPEPCPGAPDGYQWWGITSFDRTAMVGGVARAAPVLDAFIDAELASRGLSEANLALVGFSQGAMMALHVGPRRPHAVAGIVGYSGMLADEEAVGGAGLARPPVLLIHGDADPMVPLSAFDRAQAALTEAGYAVETHVSRGLGHGIDPVGVALGRQFLARVLGAR